MEDKEYKIIRREQSLNFWKFVLSTIILGFAAQYINLYVQKSKIDFDIRKEETHGFQSFLDRYTSLENGEKKLDFLIFMSTISQSPEVRARYDSLHNFVLKQIDIKIESYQKIDSLKGEIPEKVAELNRLEKVIITGETNNNQTTVKDAKIKLEKLLQEDDIQEAIDLTDKINQTENKISPFDNYKTKLTDKEAQEIILSKPDEWLKEGYYRSYNNYFLGVNELDVKDDEVQFQLRSSKEINKKIIRNFRLKIGKEEIINTDELIVIIRLNSIGSAGKNPFKKAAKYDVKILNNTN